MSPEDKIVEVVMDFHESYEADTLKEQVSNRIELVEELMRLASDCEIERNARRTLRKEKAHVANG
jgi:predicted nuclease with TOPRIM domain